MKKLILMVGLIVVGIACGDAVGEMLDVPDAGAQPGDGSSMQYVGNSTETFPGNENYFDPDVGEEVTVGIFTYYAACQETFGPGHRMCTAGEITFTTKIPQLSEGYAWYEPRTQCASSGGGSATRAAVSELGTLGSQRCGQSYALPVACCGPK